MASRAGATRSPSEVSFAQGSVVASVVASAVEDPAELDVGKILRGEVRLGTKLNGVRALVSDAAFLIRSCLHLRDHKHANGTMTARNSGRASSLFVVNLTTEGLGRHPACGWKRSPVNPPQSARNRSTRYVATSTE
eukprot:2882668-Lingulodinium_polyedra.AAC.1